jgi:hypothetical protein
MQKLKLTPSDVKAVAPVGSNTAGCSPRDFANRSSSRRPLTVDSNGTTRRRCSLFGGLTRFQGSGVDRISSSPRPQVPARLMSGGLSTMGLEGGERRRAEARRSISLSVSRRLRTAPHRRSRPDGVEEQPVPVLQHVALRVGRPRLQSKRADNAIVAVIALQHDAG